MKAEDILYRELSALREDIIKRSTEAGQKASGRTYDSITINATDTRGQLFAADYIGVLQTGRKWGKVPYNFEEILMQWADDKGIKFASLEEKEKFARALKWRIWLYGTLLYSDPNKPDIFDTAVDEFSDRLTESLGDFYLIDIDNKIFT